LQTLISVLLRSRRRWEFPRLQLSTEFVRGCISILAGLIIWEILTRLFLEDELLIPPPSSVARSFWTLAANGQLNKHFTVTLI
jgi:ABC-type nitrate/sulfonate/bicarbonate transport system permease component